MIVKNTLLPAAPVADEARPYRYTTPQYRQMHDLGFFDGVRHEFIGGEVIEMPSQSNEHYGTIEEVRDVMIALFGPNYWVRMQATLDLSPHSLPDPDIAVVAGPPARKAKTNPTTALLVIEVSDSRLWYDRSTKASLYAAAGIADYWIVNVPGRQIEIRRDPQPDATQEFGHGYATLTTLKQGATASPLALPGAAVPVDRLFV
ncbi:MAG: Uma2 family endonuclease [Gemmataceae bacterium]|nr:Uma2 family endonuclease [Gemmataceae bacterium]